MQNIKAVIFDIDGTLIDRSEAFLHFCDYLIDKYGQDYPYQGSREELVNYMTEIDANGYGGLKNVIPKLSAVWKLPHTVEEFIVERNQVFGKLTVPFPETYEVLDSLKGRYRLGVITNGYTNVQKEKIITVGIEAYFEDIIVSEEAELEKPDPRIFYKSLVNLGVKPEEAVFVGDYYPNDIAGAISAKIKPIWICKDPDEHKEYDGIRVERLKDILNYL